MITLDLSLIGHVIGFLATTCHVAMAYYPNKQAVVAQKE